MLPNLASVKGIHPGAILKRELRRRKLKSVDLATSIDEHPQTINAITKERRGINPKLSIKLGQYFNIAIDYFIYLQASYHVQNALQASNQKTLSGKLRPVLFWDTDIAKLDWQKNKRFIIQRILERGSKSEISALIKFYGLSVIKEELEQIDGSFHPNFQRNIDAYVFKK